MVSIWRSATSAIMHVSKTIMGEPMTIEREAVSIAVDPLTLKGIYEDATNIDETGAYGFANVENFKAMVDFKKTDLLMAPLRGDLVTCTATGVSYLINYVVDDGWARYRCLLEDL